MADKPIVKRSQIAKLRVAELREQLSSLGLSTTGKKDELVTRLFQHHEQNLGGADGGGLETDGSDAQMESHSDAHVSDAPPTSDRDDGMKSPPSVVVDEKPGMSDDEMVRLGAQQAAIIHMQDQEIEAKGRIQQDMIDKEKQLFNDQREALAMKQQEMIEEQHKQQQLLEVQTRALAEKHQEESMRQIQHGVAPPVQMIETAPPMMAVPVAPPVIPPSIPTQPILPPAGPPPANAPMSGPPGVLPPGVAAMGGPPTLPPPAMGGLPQAAAPPIGGVPAMGGPPGAMQPNIPPQMPPMAGPPGAMGGPPVAAQAPVIGGPPMIVPPPGMAAMPAGGPPTGPPPPPQAHPQAAMPVPVPPPRLMPTGPPPSRPTGPPPVSGPPGAKPTSVPPSGPPGAPPMMRPPVVPTRPPPSVPGGPPAVRPSAPPSLMEIHPDDSPIRVPVKPPSSRPTPLMAIPDLGKQELKLPQALEKVLAFKGERAREVGVKPEDIEAVEKGEIQHTEQAVQPQSTVPLNQQMMLQNYDYEDEDEEEDVTAKSKKESKNKRRKKKKKRSRQKRQEEAERAKDERDDKDMDDKDDKDDSDVEIEYVSDNVDIVDPIYYQFKKIFDTFKITEPEKEVVPTVTELKAKNVEKVKEKKDSDDSDSDDDMDKDDDTPKISKKKLKKMSRLSVAELKQLVSRPDVVEMHDVTARDPRLLVHLKATRNTVPVPRHWCFKRKYLQGKRGIEKPPFDLPDFIKATGIMEMRQALQDKEEAKSMKQKMRERVRPKMGKIDIDYQKLHDAFFRWQTKPKMSIHGDLYYEGKEFETRLKEKKPGNLSDDMRTALGMPIGDGADKVPPPWLIAMQRYGPPPSYPNLRVPGLNAPIPDGCSFGYHAGGWGKPPVDESGKPLYGDVFGTKSAELQVNLPEEKIEHTHWGELESESESEEESSEEEDESGEETAADQTGLITPAETGLVTPSGIGSVPVGMETPDMIEFRKKRIEDAMDQGGNTPALYQVLPEKKAAVGGAAMMGSAHVYDISAVTAPAARRPGAPAGGAEGVDVALNPEELDLDSAAMQAKYDETVREQQSHLEKEDLSDMVAEHAAKASKKRKRQQADSGKAKKYKDFKF